MPTERSYDKRVLWPHGGIFWCQPESTTTKVMRVSKWERKLIMSSAFLLLVIETSACYWNTVITTHRVVLVLYKRLPLYWCTNVSFFSFMRIKRWQSSVKNEQSHTHTHIYIYIYIYIIFKWRNWYYYRITMTRKSSKHLPMRHTEHWTAV